MNPVGVKPSVRGTPTLGLWSATLGFFVGFAAVALFGPTAKQFSDLMNLSPAQVGLLVAIPSLSGSLLRIPFSAWVDTTGGRKPFLVLLGLSVVGMAGLAYLVNAYYPEHLSRGMYPLLLLLGVLSGAGIATFSVGISQVAYWFPQSRQGFALGTYAGVGNLAPGLFSFLLPVALSAWGLAVAYLAWLAFLVVGTLLYYLWAQNAPYFQLRDRGVTPAEAQAQARALGQELFPAGSIRETLVIAARVWKTWVLVALYFTTFGGFLALTAWLPTYWQNYMEMPLVTAGGLTALYSILASAIRVFGGSLADRIGGENTAALSLATLLVGSGFMMGAQSPAPAVLGEVLMAIGMGINNAAVFKLVPKEVPQAVGGASGWVGGLGAFGGFAIPPVMAYFVGLSGTAGYAQGFLVFVVLSLISLALVYLLKRTAQTHPAPTR
ncbi:MFS transporter [Marinithermus hydrothermalis]|uniref:Major facilitator superfamily MFS_1 n=1 Tax=Marinithermus hydrothermalis (strain DSM 14884 / JCM 11576 / T1) TaxID=869210 RepID=F2NQZ7_MARHT|nr:MFS transporter [Marinithermus hydrothermalis]AEB12575.1 major facilitator superfamily MFS_1 [Marinithermus hydrothermalis DSM 14884]